MKNLTNRLHTTKAVITRNLSGNATRIYSDIIQQEFLQFRLKTNDFLQMVTDKADSPAHAPTLQKGNCKQPLLL